MTYISGITFIKNGLTLGYPILESIKSIEPLCDEIILNVGFADPTCEKDDGTWEYLNDNLVGERYKFLKSWWDPAKTSQGLILSEQTNIALAEAKGKYCQYIQGDEALHEKDLQAIRDKVQVLDERPEVDGLVFNYCHFYGNVDVEKFTKSTYKREVRLIRNGVGIKSWLDAQGFRHQDDSKLLCLAVDAQVYHYGWARPEQVMSKKVHSFNKLYHGADYDSGRDFSYVRIYGIRPFKGTHPQVMEKWIRENRSDIDVLKLPYQFKWGHLRLYIADFIEKLTGYRIGEYKNFRLAKSYHSL